MTVNPFMIEDLLDFGLTTEGSVGEVSVQVDLYTQPGSEFISSK